MIKRVVLTTLIALAVAGAIFGYKLVNQRKAAAAMAGMKRPPATVTTASATAASWGDSLSAVGTVESFQGVTLRSEIDGRILKLGFDSGAVVKTGDVLVELEADMEHAQLKSLEAAAKLAAASLERARDLRASNTNTAVEFETAEATYAQSLAAIDALKATLARKTIVAPFAGRLGIRQINVGQFLNKGDTIVTLEAVNPAYVDFALPQQQLPQLKAGLPVRVTVDAFPGRVFQGRIEAVNPRVSDVTRNVRIRAIVPNGDETLRPGLFAQVTVQLPGSTPVLELPATAVVYSPYGNSVYVVTESVGASGAKQLVAQQRFVTTGAKRGDQIAIIKGLKADEQVVTAGQMKLRNGAPVTVNNSVVPPNDPAPKPAES